MRSPRSFTARTQKSVEQCPVGGPGFVDRVMRHSSRCETECERHDDHVVERSDDGQELRDQVDRRKHPQAGDCDGDLGGARYTRILAKAPDRRDARWQDGCQILRRTWWEPLGEHDHEQPREHEYAETDENHPKYHQATIRASTRAERLIRVPTDGGRVLLDAPGVRGTSMRHNPRPTGSGLNGRSLSGGVRGDAGTVGRGRRAAVARRYRVRRRPLTPSPRR